MLYNVGVLASVLSGMIFLALYAWRLAKEARQMTDALAATEMVLAREQQLHALDGLAAAAAHELGTPLSTIAVVAKELARRRPGQPVRRGPRTAADAGRCAAARSSRKLTRGPTEPDPLHARMSVTQLIEEAASPYRGFDTELVDDGIAEPEHRRRRNPCTSPSASAGRACIYGLGNLVENAVDFADASASRSRPHGRPRRGAIDDRRRWTGHARRRHRCSGRALHHDPPGAAPAVR